MSWQVLDLVQDRPEFALAGRPAGQALSALWYLGRRHVTPATFERIAAKLPQIQFEALRSAKA